MPALFRDSAAGQLLRLFTRNRLTLYDDESPSFELPENFSRSTTSSTNEVETNDDGKFNKTEKTHLPAAGIEKGAPTDEEKATDLEPKKSGISVVDWYSDTDPDNPHNWSLAKKLYVGVLLLIYTISVYIGSSTYTASEGDIVQIFHVSNIAAALGLSLYVVAYGIGPLLFAPLSEIPAIGRNPIYIATYMVFVALTLAASLVDNFGGLLVLRFLLGFFGSPCLANAGASYGDFFGPKAMPYVIALWGGGATLSPALGPLVGGFAVQAEGWRWSSWELLWFSGPVFLVVLFTLPETSADTILLQRARRLRTITGRDELKSSSEIRQAQMSPRGIAFDALIKPWEINIKDPAVLFTTLYTALTYGLYYSFFESFPLVYSDIYDFNLGELGLAFLAVLAGLIIGVILYCTYFYYIGDPKMAKMEAVPPEARLWPGLAASFFIPVGLFLFGK
ncbi:MAG: hypothetical protein M1820_006023 [Bogoriella megaspora]|nr:MAG: hypothetical protein M1820_006023 [Bogoriella megaspora]